jgi:transposase
MSIRIHPQARTTPKIRQEIKDSGLSDRQAAKVFNITRATAAKWLGRDDTQDRSHRALTQKATLTPPQEAVVLSLRETLFLPLDDLLYITKQYINPESRGRNGVTEKDLQELRAGLHSHRYQVFATDGRRIVTSLSIRRHRPCHALGIPAYLRRHD